MSDFTIDIELSLSKSEREAMAVLDRLEKQIERLNKSIKIVANLDVSGIDSQIKQIQQKFTAGKVLVGLPDDRAIAGLETKMIASNKRIQDQVTKSQASARPVAVQASQVVQSAPVAQLQPRATTQASAISNTTPTQRQQPFPSSIELGSQSLAAIRNLQNALIASIDRSSKLVADASKQSVLKSVASIAGGQLVSSGLQNVVSNKALQQAALDKAQKLAGDENFQKASDALKGLLADQPLLQKLKDSTMDFVASLRAIEGVEPIIQASQAAFKTMQSAIDRVKTEFASLSEKVGLTATIQEAYRVTSNLTTEAIQRMSPVIDAVKARITALDERFEISAKVQSLTDSATSAYALTLGVLVDKVKALDAQYRISEDALKDLSAVFEFSKGVAKDFAEDVSGRITTLKGVFNGVGDILTAEFANLLSESPKLLAAFTSLESLASKIPFDKIGAGFGAIKDSFSELKILVEQSFDFGFLIAFEKLDARVGLKEKVDAIGDSIANFARLTQEKGLEIKDSLVNFAIDSGVVSTYKNLADEAGLTAKRLIDQFEGVKVSSGELRGVLGEVGDKYQGLSNLTDLAAKGLKIFDTSLQEVVPFLKQFDSAATGTVVGLRFLEQALERLKNAALATQIADSKGLGINVEIDPELKALPSILDLVHLGLKNLNGKLTIENLSEALLMAQHLESELKLLPTTRIISVNDADLISAIASITATELKLKQLSGLQSKISVNSSEIIDAEIVTEKLLLAASKVTSSGQLLLSASSPDLDRIEKQINNLTSRELITRPLTIDDSKLQSVQSQISNLVITVKAVPHFSDVQEAYALLSNEIVDGKFKVTANFESVVELGRALKTIQSLLASIEASPLSIKLTGGDVLEGEIVNLKKAYALIQDVQVASAKLSSGGEALRIAPSLDEKAFQSDVGKLDKYKSFDITVRAIPSFDELKTAYALLSNEIVDGKFKVTANFESVVELGRALKTIQTLSLSVNSAPLVLISASTSLSSELKELREVETVIKSISKVGETLKLAPSIDRKTVANDLSFYDGKTIEVRAVPVFEDVYTAYTGLKEKIVGLTLGVAVDSAAIGGLHSQLESVKTLITSIGSEPLKLSAASGLSLEVAQLKEAQAAIIAIRALESGPNQGINTNEFKGQTIEVRAVPVFEDVYTAYTGLKEKILDGRFKVSAIPDFESTYTAYAALSEKIVNHPFNVTAITVFEPAFAQLTALDAAIDGIKKESHLTLTADGLDGSVKAFQAVEESIKGVVSAMDTVSRLSNQSLATLKARVTEAPVGGDLRTKAAFSAKSLIDDNLLVEQNLKDLKKLASELKIEPLGNKSTKAAYITAIEEFITAGGKIGDAWKRTEDTFEDVAKQMKKVAGETGASMVQDMNHSAADTVAAAWRRTEGTFDGVTKSMVSTGRFTAEELTKVFEAAFKTIESAIARLQDALSKVGNASGGVVTGKADTGLKSVTDDATKLIKASSGIADGVKSLSTALKGGDVVAIGTTLASLAETAGSIDINKIKGLGSSLKELSAVPASKVSLDDVGKLATVATGIATGVGTLSTALNGGDFASIATALTALTVAAGGIEISKIKGLRVALKDLTSEEGGLEKLKKELLKLDESAKGGFADGWIQTRAAFQASTDGIAEQAEKVSKTLSESLTTQSADIVSAAWKRTQKTFKLSTESMEDQASKTGAHLVENLNHSAADTVGDAWKRTLKTFKGVVGDMATGATGAAKEITDKFKQVELVSKNVGAEIAFAIDSASKTIRVDADFSAAIDKTKAATAELQDKIASVRPPEFDDVMEGSTNGIRSMSSGFNGLIERVIEFKNNPPPFKEIAKAAAGAVVGITALTGGILALVTAVKASIEFAQNLIKAWTEATGVLIQGGQRIFDTWRDVTGVLVQAAQTTVEAWKTASSAIITTGQSIVSTWQSVTSSVISGGKQLFDTWKGATDAVTGFAATSVKAYADVEMSIKAVSGILDLSTKQSEDLFNSVQKTGQDASNKFSTKQISALAATLAKGGKQVDEIKQLLSPIATGATAIGEEDLAKFGGNFLDVIGKFNIPLKDSNKAVELYVKTLTSAKLDAAAFANTIKYANVEKEGVEGLKDLAAQTVAFAQVGTRGSKVGTDVNRVMTELANGLEGTSKKAAKQKAILEELGLAEEFAGDKAKDVVNRLPALAKAFNELEKTTGRDNAIAKFNELLGTKGTQAILSFSKVSAEKFQEVRAGLDKVADGSSGVVKKFASLAVAGVSGAIVTLENNLETVQASLGKSLSKTVAGFATIATSILSTIGGPESPVFKALTAVGEKVEKLFSVGGKGEELANKIGKAFEGLATKGVGVFANTIENVVSYFSDTKNINEFTKRIEYLGYVFVEVYKIATQLIGGFAAVAFQIVGAVQAFSQSSSGQALGAGMNTAFTTIATGGASLLEDKLQSIQSYFSDQTNVKNFTNAIQFVGKAALIAYSSLTDMLATMYRMSVAAVSIVDQFSKTDVGVGFFKSLMTGFQDLSEQAITLTTKRLQEFSDHLQKGDNAAQFAAQLKSIGELSLFAYDGLTQAVAGLANIGLQAAKTTNDFIKSQEGVALIDRLSTTFKKVGAEASNLIQKGLGQVFEYLSKPEVSAAIENIALGFLKLYDGLTRIVGIGFDGLLKLGSVLGAFFSSPKGQSTIDKLVEGFAKLMDVGIGFLLEQLDKFTAWANEPGNLGELVDLLKSAAELWLQNYIGLTKFNLEMAAFSINVSKGLAEFAKALEFKNVPLLDTSGTLKAIDEMTNKLAGFRLYSEEQARMDKEKSASSGNFFAGATEAFVSTIAPAVINIKAAVEDFMQNGAPALGQIFATIGVSLGLIVQVLGNAIAIVIRLITAAMPIINVILQPILGFVNLIAGALATALSVATSAIGSAAGVFNTLLSGTLDPISKFIGGMFNDGIKNMGLLSTVVAQGFASLEKIIAPIAAIIAESFVKLPENLFKIFGAIVDIVQANLGTISKATSDTVSRISDGFKGVGGAIGGAFEGGVKAAAGFGESLKSGVISKIEETKQFGTDISTGMAISWDESVKSMRSNYDDFALNFGVTSQQTDQFFVDLQTSMKADWDATTASITGKWNEFTGFFAAKSDETNTKWNEVTNAISTTWNAMNDAMSAKWAEFTSFVGTIWTATMTALQPYIDGLVSAFQAAVSTLSQAWVALTSYISSAWNTVMGTIANAFQSAMNAVGSIAQNTGNALIGFFTQAANAIGSVFAQIGQGIAAFFQPAVDAVNNIVEKLSQARSFGDGVGKVLSGQVFQGARAAGGPVTGGAGAYLVGERGPEIFVPKTDGYIVPNHAIDGFRADGGPVTAGKTYVVGEIGTEAFVSGSGKKSASFTLDFTSATGPLLAQAIRAGDHLNTIALGIKNIQQNAYSIASQTKKGFADVIAKIPAGGLGGGFTLPNLGGGLPGFGLPTQQTVGNTAASITAAFKAKDVAGIEAGLVAVAKAAGITDKAQLAYLLATAKHESDNFATLEEYASGSDYEGRSDLGNTQSGDGVRFKGRGFVQLTGRANYEKYSKKLGIDLIKNPERAADPEIAAKILADGLKTGAYTGAKLSDYGAGSGFDAIGARAIVNGSDRAGLIAGYQGQYLSKIDRLSSLPNASAVGGQIAQGLGGNALGDQIVATALKWVGKEFRPGVLAQCQNFVTEVLNSTKSGIADAIGITAKAIDDGQASGAELASRFFGTDKSDIFKDITKAQKGDLVAFGGTYGGYGKDTITHVGIYAGNGQIIDRSTSGAPVKLRSIDTFGEGNYTFARPKQYGASVPTNGGQQYSATQLGATPSILSYEQFAATSGGSASSAAQSTTPAALPTLTLPKVGKTAAKTAKASIDAAKLSVALKADDIKNLEAIYDKAKGQATITAKLLPQSIRDAYKLAGTEEVDRGEVGNILITLRKFEASQKPASTTGAPNVKASPSGDGAAPTDLETAFASLSEQETKNAINTIKTARRAGDKELLASSLTPDLRKGLGLKPGDKLDVAKLVDLLPKLEERLSKVAGSKEMSRLEQILKFNKINLSSSALAEFEAKYSKVVERQKFDLKSLGQDEVNALEKLGVLRAGALGVGESYIDEAKLKKLYGDGATIADAVNGTVKAVGDANASIVKVQDAVSGAVASSTDKLPAVPVLPELQKSVNPQISNSAITETLKSVNPESLKPVSLPTSVLDSLDFADLSTTAKPVTKPSPKSIQDRIKEIAAKTGQDAFAIQNELQKQGLKAIGAVGGTGVLPTIAEIQSALKSSASLTQASSSTASASINDRIREIVERTGLDAFKIQDELQKQGLKAIGAVDGKGILPTITEIRKILDTGLQKPVFQAAVSAGLPVANNIKPLTVNAVKALALPKTQAIESLLDSLDSADLSTKAKPAAKAKSSPIIEAAKKVGSDAFKIQAELEKSGLKAIGAIGGKGVLPTIAEIQSALKSSAETVPPGSATSLTLSDRIREIAKRANDDAFKIQAELEKQGLKAIGAVDGKGDLPTIAEIQKIVKAGNTEISKSVSTSLPTTPPAIIDSIASALGVDAKVFAGVDLKDPFAIQKALEKAGYKAIGALGADGKVVKAGAANELPTIDRIRKAVDGAMDANKGIVSAISSSTTATLDVVQAQTTDIESQIAKLYGVDATGLTGLSGFALATEIQKRIQTKGGRAVGGLNSTKANELPTISEINSKLVDLSKAIDTKQQAATSTPSSTTGAPGMIAGSTTSTTALAQKKFEFKFGGSGDTASREEVEGKLKQFEQYLNSDEFLAVAVEMVLGALKNDSRARLFSGLL